jgi:hypothetical protein
MMGFFEIFQEIFKVNAAVSIIFWCGMNVARTCSLDKDLLNAKIFLNFDFIQKTWISISVAGLAIATNALVRLGWFNGMTGIIELTYIVFLMAFIHAVYSWYVLVSR